MLTAGEGTPGDDADGLTIAIGDGPLPELGDALEATAGGTPPARLMMCGKIDGLMAPPAAPIALGMPPCWAGGEAFDGTNGDGKPGACFWAAAVAAGGNDERPGACTFAAVGGERTGSCGGTDDAGGSCFVREKSGRWVRRAHCSNLTQHTHTHKTIMLHYYSRIFIT